MASPRVNPTVTSVKACQRAKNPISSVQKPVSLVIQPHEREPTIRRVSDRTGTTHQRPRTPTTCDDKQWRCYGIFITRSCETCCSCTCSQHEARRRLSIVTVAAGYAASILAAVPACRLDPVDDAPIRRSNGTKQDPSIHAGCSRWGAQSVSCDARRWHASSFRAELDVYRPPSSFGRVSQPWDHAIPIQRRNAFHTGMRFWRR